MKRAANTLLTLLVLAACAQEAQEPSSQAEQAAQSQPPTQAQSLARSEQSAPSAAMPELPGEYRVAGVDGAGIDLPHAIAASIDEERIHLVSGCVNLAWTYRLHGARLTTERAAVEGCARGLETTERAVQAAFDAADTIRRTPANALEFSGGGHTIVLFAQ